MTSLLTCSWIEVPSPVGHLRLAASETAIGEIRFLGRRRSAGRSPPGPLPALLGELRAQLEAYFAGALREFDLPLAPAGTAFQRAVWSALQRIPYGSTRSYSAIAGAVGRPTATRAVGAANGRNPIPIVIPCHRVIGADGSLTGYGGGVAIKEHLLQLEGVLPRP